MESKELTANEENEKHNKPCPYNPSVMCVQMPMDEVADDCCCDDCENYSRLPPPADLAEIQARLKKTTGQHIGYIKYKPEYRDGGSLEVFGYSEDGYYNLGDGDIDFIAHAPKDMEKLIQALTDKTAEVEELEKRLCTTPKCFDLEKELEAEQWISVEDRLPEETGEYLILPYWKHLPCLWYQDGWYWYDRTDDAISETLGHNMEELLPNVTHWKPITPIKE